MCKERPFSKRKYCCLYVLKILSVSESNGIEQDESKERGTRGRWRIALFTVTFCHLHDNVFERGCEAISGNFALFARNCLTSTFNYIVMQMTKGNCEKGY